MNESGIRRLSLLFCLVSLLLPALGHADQGGFFIRSFHTDLEVRSNSDLLVEERIEVEFTESRRGIYRAIPMRYTDPRGYLYSFGFRLLEVVDENGRKHPIKVSRQRTRVNIRIGDPEVFHQGRMVYVIRYMVERGLGHFGDYDELYWNATGHEWNTTIENASATIRLPAAFDSDSLEVHAFAGGFGNVAENVIINHPQPGVIEYRTRGPLRAFEGLTVVAAWPPGVVQFPGRAAFLLRRLVDNLILLVPLLVLGLLIYLYRTKGRDPAGPASVMVRYEPPEGISPAELGTVVDESVDLRDITATVVQLAIEGYLEIRMEKKALFLGLGEKQEPVFARSDKPETPLLEHQKLLLRALFDKGDEVRVKDLRNSFYRKIPGIKTALHRQLTDKGFFDAPPNKVRGKYAGLGVLAALLTVAAGLLFAHVRGGIFPNAAVVPVVAAAVTLVLFLSFSHAMPRRTLSGVRMRLWARGFEEFVDRVERDRLEADRARDVFESLLPYAMALGVAEAWAERFEGIYAAGRAPGWYHAAAGSDGSFSTSAFHQGLDSAMSSVGGAMTSAPRSSGSSGSGGGGSSGGGGGGGGGGSW